jgi:phage terminase small subunit
MTKRKDPSELKIRARDDTTPVPRRKKPATQNTPEKKAERIKKLRETSPNLITLPEVLKANPDRPLTEKQRLFVKFWAEGDSILGASHRAGYSDGGTVAYRLAKDPAVLKIYDIEKALYEESCQMTRERVMEGFLEAAEMAKVMADPTALTGAWREVGKMCGYYEPVKRTIDVNVTGSVTVKQLERMSTADLLKIVTGEVTDVKFKELEDDDEEE